MPDEVPPVPAEPCNWCRSDIAWAWTSNGKRMPLDAVPTVNGNVYLTWDPETRSWRATVQTRYEARSQAWAEVPLHVHHAMTCPDAPQWNPGAAKARGSKADTRQAPSGLAPALHPAAQVRPVQEGMF